MHFTLDANQLFRDALAALSGGVGIGVVFGLVALLMAPWLIPALSKAIAEQRSVSHKREQNLLKIRNSLADRQRKIAAPPNPTGRGVGKATRK